MCRAACLTGIILLAALAVMADGFWDKKDWTEWSAEDCEVMFYSSPWVRTADDIAVPEPGQNAFVVQDSYVQFYSALPFRQASAREFQLQNDYDKASAQKKQELDASINAQFLQGYDDKIVMRLFTRVQESGKAGFKAGAPSVSVLSYPDGILILPDGTQVLSVQFVPFPGTQTTAEYRLIFPRTVNGHPVIRPDDKKLTFLAGTRHGSQFVANDKSDEVVFDLTKMMYHGKLEY
jgi:hypothetical protein